MSIYSLYIKQHNQTKLKYLGQTKGDPVIYVGSSKYWRRHLYKHGYDVTTEIIGTYETKEELSIAGLHSAKVGRPRKLRSYDVESH